MRKIIIDTDTASDDAAALMLAIEAETVDVLGITTLGGNIELSKATANALMTLEICENVVPVYEGASKPLFRKLEMADGIHGKDGMGDKNLIHPVTYAEKKNAVDFILETVANNPGEVEIIALGPATNIALAILRDSETMKKVKHIFSMGTGGFGPGNATPVAEFNVYVDAEAYKTMLDSGIPITIIGFDLCLGPAALNKTDLDRLKSSGKCGKFVADCTSALVSYNIRNHGEAFADLPDAVAMGIALWDDLIIEEVPAYCYCCTHEEETYGQVIVYDKRYTYSVSKPIPEANSTVIKSINHALFKERLLKYVLKEGVMN